MSIGKRLKETREEKKISLKEVQENLKIRTRYLEALESDNFDIIPGEAYVKAFIKSYANFLGIEHQELIMEYQRIKDEEKQLLEEMEEKDTKPSFYFRNKTLISSIIITILIIVIAFLIYYILENRSTVINVQNSGEILRTSEENNFEINNQYDEVFYDTSYREDNEIAKSIRENEEEILEKEKDLLDKNDEVYEEIEIIVTDKTWIQVLVDGENVFEGTLYNGDSKTYKYREDISLKIGNAAGILVKKDNELLGPWGEHSEVIKKVIQ